MINVRKKCVSLLKLGHARVRLINKNHHTYIRSEFSQVRGLIPLLMKRRNGGQWSAYERATLLRNLRAISNLSPYLIPILMPGGVFMLPVVAYWLDHRRNQRKNTIDKKITHPTY